MRQAFEAGHVRLLKNMALQLLPAKAGTLRTGVDDVDDAFLAAH